MTHAALALLLGREFDDFLFAPIGDDQNGPPLSVVSALARLNVDPWKEALSLARMPREEAKERLTAHIASLPNGSTASSWPKAIAARLIALSAPQAGKLNTAAPATLRQVAPVPHSRLFVGLGVLALLVVGYVIFTARATNAPGGIADAPAATSEPAVSTLGQTTRPGAHRFRRLVVSCLPAILTTFVAQHRTRRVRLGRSLCPA